MSSRDFRTIANQIIHPPFRNYRRKVWLALEDAYLAGRDDAFLAGQDDAASEDDIDKAIRDIRMSITSPRTQARR